MCLLYYLLNIYFISFSISDNNNKLIFVVTHFRHGARAPQSINDNYLDLLREKWTNPGELTGIGQRMHFILGLRNRRRYIYQEKFLSEKFDPHEILIYSSSLNRTLTSVSAQLQGLYPQSAKKGEVLTEAQKKFSYPQVDCNDFYIQEIIDKLDDSALPDYMMLAPIRMINNNERKIILFDLEGCKEKREEVKKKNRESLQILKDFTKDFNNKYRIILNNFLGDSPIEYDLDKIVSFCDTFISDYIDTRELTDFKHTGINFTELENTCYETIGLHFYYHLSGDEQKVLPHLETSKLMGEFIYYMKKRVDADINGENLEENYKDYSKPKMLMLSGHDSTLSSHEVFLLEAFELNYSYYRFPKFASQMAFEVTRKIEGPKSSYSDYIVHYYFNDEEIYNLTFKDFIEKVEPHIWTDKQINDFCGFDDEIDPVKNKSNINYQNNDNAKTTYKILMIIFIVLSIIFLSSTIYLAKKLNKMKNNQEQYLNPLNQLIN